MWWMLALAFAGEPDERAIRADLRQGAVEVLIGGAMLSATPLLAPRRDDRSEASVRGVLFATFLVNLTFNGVERRARARSEQRGAVDTITPTGPAP